MIIQFIRCIPLLNSDTTFPNGLGVSSGTDLATFPNGLGVSSEAGLGYGILVLRSH